MRYWCAALICLAVLAGTASAAGPACPVPDELALGTIALPNSRTGIAEHGQLIVLAIGGSSTAGSAAGGAAFTLPARLQENLQAALPGVAIRVINHGRAGTATRTMVTGLADDIKATGAELVIWGVGGVDAALHEDVSSFTDSLQAGIEAAHQAGADILLIDPQYAPSIARILDLTPYRDAVQSAADAAGVTRLRRYELMQSWSDDGVLDLDAGTPSDRVVVARHLYDCLATVLANAIAESLR